MDEIPIEEIINSIKNYILMKQLEKDTKLDIYQLFQKYTRIGKKKRFRNDHLFFIRIY